MNKSQLKSYAPKARREFIQMVRQRADVLGLTNVEIQKPEVQGDVAVIEGRPYPRHYVDLHTRIVKKIQAEGLDQFLDRTAYSWFNRFVALRYMEVNGYLSHPFRVLSNRDTGKNEPEILEHAAEVQLAGLDRDKLVELKLAGDRDAELYKMLLIAQCNELYSAMPFLFERVNDESELLLSENLLRTDSVIRKMVTDIDEENWTQVEIIGWLYQFYISEKKDEVIGKTVKSEDIPAATQLFTPNWIVKYMVQNSLGRLWLENHPESKLAEQMEFYIKPAEENASIHPTEDGQKVPFKPYLHPGSIKILDPACGSGHILVEAYELLKAMYVEIGYSSDDIPRSILGSNLFGLEIDERAEQLASLALLMKARGDDPRIFEKLNADGDGHLPHILTVPDSSQLEHTPEQIAEMLADASSDAEIMRKVEAYAPGKLHDDTLRLLETFSQGKTLGSLIRLPEDINLSELALLTRERREHGNLIEQVAARSTEPFVRAAIMLAREYDCIIANPPYMGSKGMNAELKAFATKEFPNSKSDLFAMFIERNLELTNKRGLLGFMSPFVWMFISSYEKLRQKIINEHSITTLVQLEYSGFAEATVPICTFTLAKEHTPNAVGSFIRLSDFRGHQNQGPKTLEAIANPNCGWFYNSRPDDFNKIPGSPIAYWVSDAVRNAYADVDLLRSITETRIGLVTGDNNSYIRLWAEVSLDSIGFNNTRETAAASGKSWFPQMKGGDYRKWYGNSESVVFWKNDGRLLQTTSHPTSDRIFAHNFNLDKIFKEGITWTKISSSLFSARYQPQGFLFNDASAAAFPPASMVHVTLGFLCSNIAQYYLALLNPTLNFLPGTVSNLPIASEAFVENKSTIDRLVKEAVELARFDWDSFETSWDFTRLWIADCGWRNEGTSVEECWDRWNDLCDERISRMQELETENNRLFINAYGLQDELSPEVPLDQITLARADKEKDTRRLLSYFIGCLVGRYSLDEPGLIYADAGGVGFDASRYKTFPADDDGIVPVTDMEWFPQEAARQFEKFIRVAFTSEGTEQLKQDGQDRQDGIAASSSSGSSVVKNLAWVAQQLGPKAGEEPVETIRRYFSTEFYKNHMQTYKKRPIYWLFSSGKQKAFEALVYLHRYSESTLPRMRQEYVLPLMSKIEAQIETLAGPADQYGNRTGGLIETSTSTSERNKLTKQLETLKKKQTELAAFDEKLRHYTDMRITLDLDDGVKVNYAKFGDLLAEVKAITG